MTISKITKILLLEDNTVVQSRMKMMLEKLNCTVDIVDNGYAAVKAFNDSYSLMVSDIKVPGISGIEACKLIRAQHPDSKVPIIAVSTAPREVNEPKCLAAGMQAFFAKRIEPLQMKAILEKYVKGYVAPEK